ncbi:hypothetical protein TBLA_0A08670 [Henningerozyma blattae CBS 6284]|uniref:DNA damage-inducible protein 1 n=1 Tax=Henningerozyma blattae (strain ATCC 34711 / CBS 6284 / DSM 70876 / NBRC 10599 / NRRL Y-10934 / UCD 77-7) TaxID=1071380 RepID=I2GX04_HENB6|nr:hypothetical protein TBLA_0A08670 [Tetrapisispora blattae CBS 6284]CCH58656.1 hypothetical protein TBLA_0A08670 [Tetrapisispora blattae CBS 6284]
MQVTISNEITGQVYGPLDLSDDMTVPDLLALIELECQFDKTKHDLYHNTDLIDKLSEKTMKDLNIENDDLLLIRQKIPTMNDMQRQYADRVNQMDDVSFVEEFRQELLHNAELRNKVSNDIPDLETIIQNKEEFNEKIGPILIQRRRGMPGNGGGIPQNSFGIPQQDYIRLMSNPDDPENQKKIVELINQQEIDEQMRNALEYTPEVFTQVNMLFINMEINGHPVKAFVDSGAQTTIMTPKIAELTGLSRLIDKRFKGEARGVGVGKILGKIHQAQVKIETQFIPCSFTVLETDVDILLGLDMLRRHQAIMDLERDVLKIAGVETKFLGEAEIPKFGPQPKEEKTSGDASGNITHGTSSSAKTQSKSTTPAQVTATTPAQATSITPAQATAITPAQTTSTTPVQPKEKYPEATIKQLMDLGFSKMEVVHALDMTNGNAEMAASLLFSM